MKITKYLCDKCGKDIKSDEIKKRVSINFGEGTRTYYMHEKCLNDMFIGFVFVDPEI